MTAPGEPLLALGTRGVGWGQGEALHPGETVLAAGERYDAPTALFTWSDRGLDGVSRAVRGAIATAGSGKERR